MSYRIEYDGSVGKYEVQKVNPWRLPMMCLTVFGVCFLGMCLFRPQLLESLRAFLIPGEDAVTVLAFQAMTNDLRSGAGLYEAFYDFCKLVIHGV